MHHLGWQFVICLCLTYGRSASTCEVTNPTYSNVAILLMPVVTKDLLISPRFSPYDFFIAMQVQVQHSYNSSTSG